MLVGLPNIRVGILDLLPELIVWWQRSVVRIDMLNVGLPVQWDERAGDGVYVGDHVQ